jgi:hypothetical protein
MKALLAFVAAMTLGALSLLAADTANQKADRELLGRLHATFVPALRLEEVPVERAITRYLELLAAEWHSPKPFLTVSSAASVSRSNRRFLPSPERQ